MKVALGFGHWNTEYNAMLCLSDHQTMAFNDQSTIPKTTFIEVGEYFSPFRTSSISNEASFTYSPKWSYVSFTTPGHIQNQIQLNHCLSVPIVNLCSSNTTGPYTSQLSALYPRNFYKYIYTYFNKGCLWIWSLKRRIQCNALLEWPPNNGFQRPKHNSQNNLYWNRCIYVYVA